MKSVRVLALIALLCLGNESAFGASCRIEGSNYGFGFEDDGVVHTWGDLKIRRNSMQPQGMFVDVKAPGFLESILLTSGVPARRTICGEDVSIRYEFSPRSNPSLAIWVTVF